MTCHTWESPLEGMAIRKRKPVRCTKTDTPATVQASIHSDFPIQTFSSSTSPHSTLTPDYRKAIPESKWAIYLPAS